MAWAGQLAVIGLIWARVTHAQYKATSKEPKHYDEYSLYSAGYDSIYEDNYNRGYSGAYEEELGAYDNYFEEYEMREKDCRIGPDGRTPQFNGTRPCDLKVEGVDKVLKGMPGGLDGVYEVHSCENGKASYLRKGAAPGQDRLLWYSSRFSDWDVNNGSVPREDDVLLYGKGGGHVKRPELVGNIWKVDSLFLQGYTGSEEYEKVDLTMVCGDGSKTELPAVDRWGRAPLLTEDEVDAQYSQVYNHARMRAEAGGDHSWGLVALLAALGLGPLGALLLVLARQRRLRAERGARPSRSPSCWGSRGPSGATPTEAGCAAARASSGL